LQVLQRYLKKLSQYLCTWAQFCEGHGGRVAPTFSGGADIICHASPLFLFRFCIWRGFKNKSDVCHVLCEELFMLDRRFHIAKFTLKQSFVWYHWFW